MDSAAKLSDIITELQNLEGINQKADLKSALVAKGISATDTDTMADLISKVNNLSNIKRIQNGTINLSVMGTNLTYNIPISPVGDLTKTIVNVFITSASMGNSGSDTVYATMTDASTLCLTRYAGMASTVTVYYEVIEFNNVKSVQNIVTTQNNGTITISSKDQSKTQIYLSATYHNAGVSNASNEFAYIKAYLTSSTVLTLCSNATWSTISIFIIEFY
jgi:hypothetical protein